MTELCETHGEAHTVLYPDIEGTERCALCAAIALDKDVLILNGALEMWEQEGGFAAPCILIDDVQLDRAILAWLNVLPENDRGGSLPDDVSSYGSVRITIEMLSPPIKGTD